MKPKSQFFITLHKTTSQLYFILANIQDAERGSPIGRKRRKRRARGKARKNNSM